MRISGIDWEDRRRPPLVWRLLIDGWLYVGLARQWNTPSFQLDFVEVVW